MKPEITFGILGPIVINDADGSASHPSGREARVLAALLLSVNNAVPTHDLIATVWADTPPASPETALHNVVYRLRRTIEEARVNAAIEKEADGYSLRADPMIVDSMRFERMLENAESEVGATAHKILSDAISLWRGEPFGAQMNGTQMFHAEAERLTALRWIAIEDRIKCDLTADNHREVIPELVSLTTRAPIRETLWGYLMAALYRSDQRGRALQAYKQAQRYFAEELDIEPGRQLQELAQAIVDQDDDAVTALTAG